MIHRAIKIKVNGVEFKLDDHGWTTADKSLDAELLMLDVELVSANPHQFFADAAMEYLSPLYDVEIIDGGIEDLSDSF